MAETREVLPYPILGGEGGGDQSATHKGSGSHLSGEATDVSSSLRDIDPSRGPAAPGVLWSAWSETDADSDPSDPSVTYCTEWFIGRWPVGTEEPECQVLIGEGRSAEIIARRVAEKLTSILNTDRIRSGAHGWRADCFRTRMSEFDVAYKKARESSHPQDWMDAALLAQQFRNVAYAVLTGEAPRQEHPRQTILKPCPWEEEHLCCYPKCNCAPDRETAPCDGSGEADETEGLSPKGDSAVTEGQAPDPSPPPPPEGLPEEIVKDDRFDYIAIGPHGVYALCSDDSDPLLVQQFLDNARVRGHRTERVPVAEAVERHLAYLRKDPHFAAAMDARAALDAASDPADPA